MAESFTITLVVVLGVYSVMGVGALCGKMGWLTAETRKHLLAIVVNVLMPCLIVKNVLFNNVFQDTRNLYGPPLIGFGIILASVVFAWLIGRFLPTRLTTLDTRQKIGTFAACLGMLNYGYVPIPLISNLYPDDSGVLAVLFVQNIGTEFALWTIVVFAFLGRFDNKTIRSLVNIPVCVIVACLLINVLVDPDKVMAGGAGRVIESLKLNVLFWKPVEMLAVSAIPLSLLCVGGAIAEQFHAKDFTEDLGKTTRLSLLSVFFRLFVFPPLILLAAKYLPCSNETKIVTAIYAAMSSASFPVVMSETYGGDIKTALLTSLSNSAVAVATTPLWLIVGMKWVLG